MLGEVGRAGQIFDSVVSGLDQEGVSPGTINPDTGEWFGSPHGMTHLAQVHCAVASGAPQPRPPARRRQATPAPPVTPNTSPEI